VLSQVLNDYDQETNDFYRWEVQYTQEYISVLIKNRIGIDVGLVQEFVPIARGASGRLIRLKIVGSKKR
jgi:stage II sporulation protein D